LSTCAAVVALASAAAAWVIMLGRSVWGTVTVAIVLMSGHPDWAPMGLRRQSFPWFWD
jgi:hypothetical protein